VTDLATRPDCMRCPACVSGTLYMRWLVPGIVLAVALSFLLGACGSPRWSDAERAAVASLALDRLPPLPADPSNRVADDPAAAALGRALFFDTRFSASGTVSCATCHQPGLYFTDGLPRATGEGSFHRHTMALIGVAWSPWLTWDGKADSLWSQALLPLENPVEQGLDRTAIAHLIARDHATAYEAIFGPLPPLDDGSRFPPHAGPLGNTLVQDVWASMAPADRDAVNRVFSNAGKALAAFQRTLAPAPSRFDRWAAALATDDTATMRAALSPDEEAGLRLFIGKAQCLNCHNGPLLTNNSFHNTAVPPVAGLPVEQGRVAALAQLQESEFGCLGDYSDAAPDDRSACTHVRFMQDAGHSLMGAFRTPTLRNVAETAPYMHAGQLATLSDVVRHYNDGGLALVGHSELVPLGLSDDELAQLEAFLHTLTQEAPPLAAASNSN